MRPLALLAAMLVLCGCESPRAASSHSPVTVASPSCATPGTCPPDRVGGAYGFDQERQALVVFGGVARPPSVVNGKLVTLNDTWEWSAERRWTNRTSQTSPSPRDLAAMAYDPAMHAVLLYGGRRVAGGTVRCDDFGEIFCSTDTWAWNGTTWTELHPKAAPDLGPSTMAFDYAAGQMVLYGFNFGTYGTSIWDGTGWSSASGESGSPQPGRSGPRMSFDPSTRRVVMYGGFNAGGGDLSRMWSWNGGSWSPLQATAPGSEATTTDSQIHGLLAYLGPRYHGTATNYIKDAGSETWRWDGSRWVQLSPAHDPDVFATAMFDDPKAHRALLIGVRRDGDLQIWTWAGSDWNRLG